MTSRIITEYVCPPIPIRDFDWRATRDSYEPGDPMGEGRTEQEAIADLLEKEGADTTETFGPNPEKLFSTNPDQTPSEAEQQRGKA